MNNNIPEEKIFIQTPRIHEIDAVRGFAVFGMLMINARVFSGYTYDDPEANIILGQLDYYFDWIHMVFFNGKFYSLFSLLFGVSFAIQMAKSRAGKSNFLPLFGRRLFILFLIGIIHLWGIWFSDIVALYAVCGFFLIPFRNLSQRSLLRVSLLILFLPGLHALYVVLTNGGYVDSVFQMLAQQWEANGLPTQNTSFSTDDIALVTRHGTLDSVLRFNSIGPLVRLYLISLDARFFKVLGIFFLGVWAGRAILLHDLHRNRPLLKKVALVGLIIGLPLNIFVTITNLIGMSEDSWFVLRNTLLPFAYIILALSYTAFFLLIFNKGFDRILGFVFGAVGKTALTNYIFQSFAGIFLFYGIGLGLWPYFGSTMITLAVIAIFGFQIMMSRLWLQRFRFGPIEWIWRVLTYGKFIPNIKS